MQTPLKCALVSYLYNKIIMREARDSADIYMRQARGFPRINRQKEAELGRRIAANDDDSLLARNELIQANLSLVIKIAKLYISSGFPLNDLIQEGNLGLMEAASKFDPSREVKFSTYAAWRIRAKISDLIDLHNGVIRIPGCKRQLLRHLQKIKRHSLDMHGRNPTWVEIVEYLQINERDMAEPDLIELIALASGTISLDATIGDGQNQPSVQNIADNNLRHPEVDLHIVEVWNQLAECMERVLTSRDIEILKLRYYISIREITERGVKEYAADLLPLETIGSFFGITREGARKALIRAEKKLREALRAQRIELEDL